jgi:hypothetical protein
VDISLSSPAFGRFGDTQTFANKIFNTNAASVTPLTSSAAKTIFSQDLEPLGDLKALELLHSNNNCKGEAAFRSGLEQLALGEDQTILNGGPASQHIDDDSVDDKSIMETTMKTTKHQIRSQKSRLSQGIVRVHRPRDRPLRKESLEHMRSDNGLLRDSPRNVQPTTASLGSVADRDHSSSEYKSDFVDVELPNDDSRSSSETNVKGSVSSDDNTDSFEDSSATDSEYSSLDSGTSEVSAVSLQSNSPYDLGEQVVDRLMRCFCAWWYKFLRQVPLEGQRSAIFTSLGTTSSDDSKSSSSHRSTDRRSQSTYTNDSGQGKHHGGSDSGDDDAQDDKDDERPSKRRRKLKGDGIEANRLACPFFKRNPQKYQSHKMCPGPGWDTVARLKCVSPRL